MAPPLCAPAPRPRPDAEGARLGAARVGGESSNFLESEASLGRCKRSHKGSASRAGFCSRQLIPNRPFCRSAVSVCIPLVPPSRPDCLARGLPGLVLFSVLFSALLPSFLCPSPLFSLLYIFHISSRPRIFTKSSPSLRTCSILVCFFFFFLS